MSAGDAFDKLEEARKLIEDAKTLVESRRDADAKELQELKKKLSEKDREVLTANRALQRKDQDLRSKEKELLAKTEALEKSKEPVKKFIQDEIAKSYSAVKDANAVHEQSPSKYTAGFVELAKGSHEENEEMFKRLAKAVGIEFGELQVDLDVGGKGGENGKAASGVVRPLNSRRITPREPFHLSRYASRAISKPLERRDSGTEVQ